VLRAARFSTASFQ